MVLFINLKFFLLWGRIRRKVKTVLIVSGTKRNFNIRNYKRKKKDKTLDYLFFPHFFFFLTLKTYRNNLVYIFPRCRIPSALGPPGVWHRETGAGGVLLTGEQETQLSILYIIDICDKGLYI